MLGASCGGAGSAAGNAMPWVSSTVAVGAGSGGTTGCVRGFGTTWTMSFGGSGTGGAGGGGIFSISRTGVLSRGTCTAW